MRVIFFIVALLWSSSAFCEVDQTPDKVVASNMQAAKSWGYSPVQAFRLHTKLKRKIDVKQIQNDVASAMEKNNVMFAAQLDQTIENILRRADGVLRKVGYTQLADDINSDYQIFFRGYFATQLLGKREIGDHPPISEWLGKVHTKIEEAIGEFWCKFFHLHDLFILNHGIPVVFAPSKYDLRDYKDHFAGHLMFDFLWDHHGVAGVITYWLVDGVCAGASAGLGLVVFACSPIATLAEHVMDKRIAPPIATRVWNRANQ